jgi:type I restriction enzyme S subunit
MKTSSIAASDVSGTFRFDAKYHFSRSNPLIQDLRAGHWPIVSIAETFGRENVWTGNIFSRVYTDSPAHGRPLLVPYDLFRYVPWSNKILSESQVSQFDKLKIKRGWLFLVCSGRNLGPVTIADSFCEQFVMSHDMIRIAVEPSNDLFYLAAFLSTAHGQAVIRTDMNGSVIDHTDANQVAAIRYPLVSPALQAKCALLFKSGFEKRERARLLLAESQTEFAKYFRLQDDSKNLGQHAFSRRFTIKRSEIAGRFDAEFHAPIYSAWRKKIASRGGLRLSDIADIQKPFGRYKTNYVDDPAFGIKMMNGRQISQYRPIALRAMNISGFSDPEQFRIAKDTTLLTADGRAEENLADCVLVTEERDGWGASGHVHRVLPREGVNPGLLYLACSCAPVQSQLKAMSTGSVVDALSTTDVGSVVVPFEKSATANAIGDKAQHAWGLFAESAIAEAEAIELLERAFAT